MFGGCRGKQAWAASSCSLRWSHEDRTLHRLHVFPDMTNMKNLEWAAANYVKNWGAGSQ